MVELAIGAALVVGMVATAVWMARSSVARRDTGASRQRKEFIDLGNGNEVARDGDEPVSSDDAVALEQTKLVVHALLQNVSESVEALHDDSSSYGDSLDEHKSAITKAQTIAGLRELERVMLTELDGIRSTNIAYRQQLDKANTKLKRQQEELEKLQSDAGIDFLTKIPNRRSLDNRAAEEFNRAKRYGSTFSLIIIDVDHFKRVNDVYGHLAGDRILRAIAHLLDEQRRASDFLARFGGEEFVLLLPETSADQARILAETTRKKMALSTFRYEKQTIRITVSAGVGEIVPSQDSAKTLFSRVDAALYRAKEGGRNRVELAEVPAPAKDRNR